MLGFSFFGTISIFFFFGSIIFVSGRENWSNKAFLGIGGLFGVKKLSSSSWTGGGGK